MAVVVVVVVAVVMVEVAVVAVVLVVAAAGGGCDCGGRSAECAFDPEQYRSTGRGGRCLNCGGNTDGPHCERCRENHHRASPDEPCRPCDCNVDGSEGLQCGEDGGCVCRSTVTGDKCDTCQAGFHSLGPGGC
ncbi:hypothetical protein CRUP_038864, partial [Coryphaenoides rupestris]